ncbi:MAG: FG-GAP and VCBS repeat-containing protein [Acidobacteriota bacterium]
MRRRPPRLPRAVSLTAYRDGRIALPSALLLALALLALLAPRALAEADRLEADRIEADRIEISKDGAETAVWTPDPIAAARALVGSGGVPTGDAPYGDAPDWSNTLRRQIGGVLLTDVDGDQRDDLVAVCFSSNSFPPYDDWRNLIYRNVGEALEDDPSWISVDQISNGDVQAAFIDDDPYLDLFVASNAASRLYAGGPTGPSTQPGWAAGGGATWETSGLFCDLDRDGYPELITTAQGFGQSDPFRPMRVYDNVDGVLETAPSWQSAESSIQNFLACADVTGDEWPDVAVAKWANFESGIYRNDGAGTLELSPFWTTGDTDTDRGIALGDLDGDDDVDLALGHDPTERYDGDGIGGFTRTWTSQATFFGQQDLKLHDVDGDGDLDLAEIHFSNGVTNIYLNRDGVLDASPSWSYDAPSVGNALAFGDVNGDGFADLAIGLSGDPSLLVFLNRRPFVFSDGFESADLSAWTAGP